MTIDDILNAYLDYLSLERRMAHNTLVCYRSDLNTLATIDKPLEEIAQKDIRALMREQTKAGKSVATIDRKVKGYNTLFKWLILEGYVIHNPVEGIRLPKRPDTIPLWLSTDELRTFVETPARLPRLQMAWALLAYLGLRRSEVINLTWECVRLEDKTLVILNTKTKKDRVLPIELPLHNAFQKYKATFSKGPFIHQLVCPGHDGEEWSTASFRYDFIDHLSRCNLEGRGIHPHTLRHTFATLLALAGVHITVIQDFMGHKDIKTTRRYIHHDPQFRREAMKKFPLNI